MIKFGIIGCGSISGVHAAAIENIEEAKIVACCDTDEVRGRKFAEKNNCQYFKNYPDLLKQELDVVTIATPHYLHKEMSIAALKAGKHVICEKPMAISSEEAQQVIEVANASNRHYAVCFQNRFNESFIECKRRIEAQEFGKLRGMKCELTWKRDAAYYAAANWKGSWQTEGGGVLINQAIHTLDAISWLFEQPYRVKGKIMTSLLDGVVEVEDAAMATAQLADHTPIVIFASNDYSTDANPVMTFDFEKATVALTMQDLIIDGEIVEDQKIVQTTNKKNIWGNGHNRFVRAFVNQINGVADPLIPNLAKNDAKNAIDLLTGIYKSSAVDQWIKLSNN
jgi:predicted dehydrogenase